MKLEFDFRRRKDGKSRRRRDSAYTENGQQNVDEEISAASALEENAERWEDDGEDDLANVAFESGGWSED